MKVYPVADRLTRADLEALGNPSYGVGAVLTGEKRPPRKGEWYLSGATPEAYRAPNDLTQVFHIVRLIARVK
jgi:hypothetical protein